MKRLHPQGIPWPMSLLYNRLSLTKGFQEHYELVARDILARQPSGRILDFGTGPGWLLVKLHRLAPNISLAGSDISPGMTAKAKKNLGLHGLDRVVPIELNRPADLPFADQTFDAVVSTASIHHWKDPLAELEEIFRVLKPGGRALIYDLALDTPKEIKIEARKKFGRLGMTLLWLHAFEEPFNQTRDFKALAAASPFEEPHYGFVGVFFAMALTRPLL